MPVSASLTCLLLTYIAGSRSSKQLHTNSLSVPDSATIDPSRLRIPDTHTLDECLRYWDNGDVHKGLLVPLKNWPSSFKPSTYRSEAVKWGKIKNVVHEYRDVCGSDRDMFESCYPGLSDRYAKLCKAINTERQTRGELVERPKKRQRTETSADV